MWVPTSRWLAGNVKTFVQQEIPDLLSLCAQALREVPIPTTFEEWNQIDRNTQFAAIPKISALIFWLALPICMLRPQKPKPATFWLTRDLLLRAMGVVYTAAFLTSAIQNRALFGSRGLMPASYPPVKPAPVFQLMVQGLGLTFTDSMQEAVAWGGVLLALLQMLGSFQSSLVLALLWVLYLSLVNMGTIMANYGWEWLTLEVGFLMIFLCPMWSRSPYPAGTPPSPTVLWLLRWCAFRLMIGAGMSKLGGNASDCWKELTCTTTHYSTQPMPTPLAWYFHGWMPVWVHKLEVGLTFIEQLVLPWLLLLPSTLLTRIAALGEIAFQTMIVATGNYAWINYIGCVPCLALLDDTFLARFFPKGAVHAAARANQDSHLRPSTKVAWGVDWTGRACRGLLVAALALLIAFKSTQPLKELFTRSPWLHTYDDYYLVSAQGVFGFINQRRVTLTLDYTHDTVRLDSPTCGDQPGAVVGTDNQGNGMTCTQISSFCNDPRHGQTLRRLCPGSCGLCTLAEPGRGKRQPTWHPLEFKSQPNSLVRRPSWSSPYHLRLDWEVWIHVTARMERMHGKLTPPPFVLTLVQKVLSGDTDAISLLGTPRSEVLGEGGTPPVAIQARFWEYELSSGRPESSEGRIPGTWWRRTELEHNFPMIFNNQTLPWKGEVTRSAPQRSWMLLLCMVGMAMSISSVLHSVFGPLDRVVTLEDRWHISPASPHIERMDLVYGAIFITIFFSSFLTDYHLDSPLALRLLGMAQPLSATGSAIYAIRRYLEPDRVIVLRDIVYLGLVFSLAAAARARS